MVLARARVFYGWWMLFIEDIIYVIHAGVYYYGMSSFIIPLTQEFGWTRAEISVGVSFSKVDSSVDGLVSGWMSDHLGPRWTAIITLGISGILLFALGFTNSLGLFYALMFLVFVLPTSPFIALATAVARWFHEKAGTALGLLSVAGGLTGLITPVLMWIIIDFGWRTAFSVAGLLVLLCIPLAFFIRDHGPEYYGLLPDGKAPAEKKVPEENGGSQDPTRESERVKKRKAEVRDFMLKELLRTKSYWLINIAYSLSNFSCQAIILHLVPYLVGIGFESQLAALGVSVVTLSSAVGRFMFGWLGDRFPKRYLYALSFALMLVGSLALVRASVPWATFLALALFGPGMGGMFVSRVAIQREYYGSKHWGITQGFTQFVSSLPAFLGPVYAGWMFDNYGSYVLAFTSLILFWIVAIVLIIMARPPSALQGARAV